MADTHPALTRHDTPVKRDQERPARQYTNKQWEGYYSVYNDGAPYHDKFTKALMEEKEAKKKWVDKSGFVVHGGGGLKLREDYGVVASGPVSVRS